MNVIDISSLEIESDRDTLDMFNLIHEKSLEIEKAEQELDILSDEFEKYINLMNKGRFSLSIRDTIKLNSKIIRFNFKKINIISFSNSVTKIYRMDKSKEIYNKVYVYFDIEQRIKVINNKVEELKKILKNYTSFSLFGKNIRRDIFEVILLGIFPLFRIIRFLMQILVK